MENFNDTTAVIADGKTGSVYCGIFDRPTLEEIEKLLVSIKSETGNKDYDYMSFKYASELEKTFNENKTATYDLFWEKLTGGEFVQQVQETAKEKQINSSEMVFNIMKPIYENDNGSDVEAMWFMFMDSKNRMLGLEKMFSGSINSASIYTREIIKKAIDIKAACCIMIHNHPSGCPEPSLQDKRITHKVYNALLMVDITLHDHMIIGSSNYSFADNGYMTKYKMLTDAYLTSHDIN